MKKQGITLTYVAHETTDDLKDTMRNEILGEDWDEKGEYPIYIEKGNTGNNWEGQAYAVSIRSLKELIGYLEDKGANYVEIMFHGDHGEYELSGLEIHKTTAAEMREYNNGINKQNEEIKQEEIARLKARIKQLEKQ